MHWLQAKLCSYRTTSPYFICLHYVVCCSISANRLAAIAIHPPSLRSLHCSGFSPDQGLTVDPQSTNSVSQVLPATADSTSQSHNVSRTSFRLCILKSTRTLTSFGLQMGEATVRNLIEIIHSDYFLIDLFKSTYKSANSCKDMMQRNKEKLGIENEFQKRPFTEKCWTSHRICSLLPERHYKGFARKVSLSLS